MKFLLATSLWMRLSGLLVPSRCNKGETLVLIPCKSIHSFGMQGNLDVAFLDSRGRVLLAERNVAKRQKRSHPQAVAVLERRSKPEEAWVQKDEMLCLSSHVNEQEKLLEGN